MILFSSSVYFIDYGPYCSAISVHSALVNFQSICNQFFVACHDVCKVSQTLRCVSVCSYVNMYTSPYSCVADCSCLAKSSHKLLQGFNVAVVKNRCDQFALFSIASCNADVFLEFPFSALCVQADQVLYPFRLAVNSYLPVPKKSAASFAARSLVMWFISISTPMV